MYVTPLEVCVSAYMRACEGTRLPEHHLCGLLLHRDDTQVIFASVRKKSEKILGMLLLPLPVGL